VVTHARTLIEYENAEKRIAQLEATIEALTGSSTSNVASFRKAG